MQMIVVDLRATWLVDCSLFFLGTLYSVYFVNASSLLQLYSE